MTVPVSAIILAAGKSTRMGITKQLMPLGQTTILGQVIDNFLGSKTEEIIVVVGHRDQEIVRAIGKRPVKIALNRLYNQGMSTSMIAGLSLVSNKSRGFIFALADQPFIDSKTIDSLIRVFEDSVKGIVVPLYKGIRGHPVIFSTKYQGELMALKGDTGGREIIARHPEDVLKVNVDCSGIVHDMDTLDEYIKKAKKHPIR